MIQGSRNRSAYKPKSFTCSHKARKVSYDLTPNLYMTDYPSRYGVYSNIPSDSELTSGRVTTLWLFLRVIYETLIFFCSKLLKTSFILILKSVSKLQSKLNILS